MNVIVYKSDDGGIVVVCPAPEALAEFGIDAIARKDVPSGKPYAIMNASQIPEDRTFRAAWTIDGALLVDGVGSESNSFEEGQP